MMKYLFMIAALFGAQAFAEEEEEVAQVEEQEQAPEVEAAPVLPILE